MASEVLIEIKSLYNRLQTANNQANILKIEIDDIKTQIRLLSGSEIFRKISISDVSDKSSGLDKTDNSEPNRKKARPNFSMEDDFVIVYTDGACENNGKANAKAGIGVWFGDNHPLNISKPVDGKATNNVAEIQACINAIEVAKSENVLKLIIFTDSQFTINCMTKWIRNWKKNNWKLASKGDVKNKELLVQLDQLCNSIAVKWKHVAAHCGIQGNEAADSLAREGARRYVAKS